MPDPKRTSVMRASGGFTLLELLVAVAIFAVVAALAWGGLDAIVGARRVLDAEAAQLAQLQRAFGRFERDLGGALPRPIRDERGRIAPALAGTAEQFEVTTWLPGAAAAAPLPQRVSWACVDGQLRRTHWEAPDRNAGTRTEEQVLLGQVTDCHLRYRVQDGTATEHWPLPEMPPTALPRGVELGFRIAGHGEFRRVIELVQAAESRR